MELAIAEEGLGGRLNGDLQSADGKPRPLGGTGCPSSHDLCRGLQGLLTPISLTRRLRFGD